MLGIAKTLPANTKPSLPTAKNQTDVPYWKIATSDNTRKAYQADIRHFIASGGLLPATTETIIQYLETQASQVNPRTLKRRLVAIKQWHILQNSADPTANPLIKKTLSGIARVHGQPPQRASIISVAQLNALARHLALHPSLINLRDNALIQMGFFGAFRRSELVAIKWEHITFVPQGIEILIPHSKTDQEGKGAICAIPYGEHPLCPITALRKWQEQTQLTQGFVFRGIRHEKYSHNGLSATTVNQILKRRAEECLWPHAEQFSGHSLRRGFATAASQQGATMGAIMRQGRWRHEGTVHGYIEESNRFEANAAAAILNKKTKILEVNNDG